MVVNSWGTCPDLDKLFPFNLSGAKTACNFHISTNTNFKSLTLKPPIFLDIWLEICKNKKKEHQKLRFLLEIFNADS